MIFCVLQAVIQSMLEMTTGKGFSIVKKIMYLQAISMSAWEIL